MAALQKKSAGRSEVATHNLVGQRLGRKGQETRDRIIGAMSDLLQTIDDTPVTLSAVARAAGLGMSTLYLYFPDMGELVLAVLDRTLKENEAGFDTYLGEFWPDDRLSALVLAFTRAHFAFWDKYSRLLQMRNSFADARDMRFVEYRQKMTHPVMSMLVRQMGAQPGACDPLFEDCAAVMLTGLERVATVVINPDFDILAKLEGVDERVRYVERLAQAEALLMELMIREMRQRACTSDAID